MTKASGTRARGPAFGGTRSGTKRVAKWKWALLGVALALVLAAQMGWLGFGFAHLMSLTFPKDESLLAFVPDSAGGIAILDPHQLDLKALGGEQGKLRQNIERIRADLKKATGIDLAFDVDKAVFSPELVVARGRFSEKHIGEKLGEYRYTRSEYKGTSYLVRQGEDALAIVDGVLLYGPESSVKLALDTKENGRSLAKDEKTTDRLDEIGWKHALVVALRIHDDKPSLKSIVAGASGPRAVTVGLTTKGGIAVHAIVEAASPESAQDIAKLIDERRANADAFVTLTGPELGAKLADVAKKATVKAEPESRVVVRAQIDPPSIDAIAAAAASLPLTPWDLLHFVQQQSAPTAPATAAP
jgi:hypothetical protein